MKKAFYLTAILFCVAVSIAWGAETRDAWPLFRGDASATGFSPTRLDPPLVLDWEFEFELKKDEIKGSPVVADAKVFVASFEGHLVALSLDQGTELWRFSTEAGFIASPSFRNGRIYIGNEEGRVFCVDAKNGKKIWDVLIGGVIHAAVNFDGDDRLLVTSEDGSLRCLATKDGKELWRYRSKKRPLGFDFDVEPQLRCFPSIVGRLAVLGGCNGQLIVVDLDTGKQVRSVDLDNPTGSTAAVRGNLAFLGTEGYAFWAIDHTTGKIAWKYEPPRRSLPFRSLAAVTDSKVVVGSGNKRLYAFDLTSGEMAWNFPTRGRVNGSPLVLDKIIYFGSEDDRLYALDVENGKELWRFELGGNVSGSPVPAGNRLLVAIHDGRVLCFVQPR